MPKKSSRKDEFPNVVYVKVTETAANTLTFEQIQTGYGALNRLGWIISRIEYYFKVGDLQQFADAADAAQVGLTKSDLLSSLNLQDSGLIDLLEVSCMYKTGVGLELVYQPIIRDFSQLPGGGKLVLPYPLFLGVQGISLANALEVSARISYTEITMGGDEFTELAMQDRLLT